MKKEWLVVLALIFVVALNGCCRCKKEMMNTSTTPTASAQAAPAPSQTAQPQSNNTAFSGQSAIK